MSTGTIIRKQANQADPSGDEVELDENVKVSQYINVLSTFNP